MVGAVRAVVLDVGGVIAAQDVVAADAGYGAVRPGLTAREVNRVRDGAKLYPQWVEYSVGAMSTPVYWMSVARELGLGAAATERLRAVHSATVWAVVDQDVLDVVRSLRERGGLALGVLSNSSPDYDAYIPTFEALFDVLHFSHLTGHRKPDAEAYAGVCTELGVEPGGTLFVDDKDRNVRAAARLGMIARRFESAADLIREFRRLGLLGDADRSSGPEAPA